MSWLSEDNDNEMPQYINVMKVHSYDVGQIVDEIKEARKWETTQNEITIDDVMEYVQNLAKDDFSCGWGHEANVRDLIFQDENGNDL